jgi:GNAT superfamily N-acetyltransferase
MTASLVWEDTREQLLANPDAVEVPADAIAEQRLRVAADELDEPIGFSLVLAPVEAVVELDGLFVLPELQHAGVGSALMDDLTERAVAAGATAIEVTAGPAVPFYEKHGFVVTGEVQTRFSLAVRLRKSMR